MTRYAFGPTVLELTGPPGILRGFEREYGRAAGAGGPPDLRIAFGAVDGDAAIAGRHKTVGWRVRVSSPEAAPLEATVELSGVPRGFARSLVQGFVAEPLLSVAVARSDRVLLPAAAVEEEGGALLVVGRSRSGKTTLMAGAAARQRRVLGDDQVLIEPAGRVAPFPRRLRLYTDLPRTAPDAHARLAPALRARLRVLAVLRALSGGWVAPSLGVPVGALGPVPGAGSLPLTRIVLVERSRTATQLERAPLPPDAATWAAPVLAEQRTRLEAIGGSWPEALRATAQREDATLRQAFAGVTAERVAVPWSWSAERSVPALAALLRL